MDEGMLGLLANQIVPAQNSVPIKNEIKSFSPTSGLCTDRYGHL